jgi:hypothetical protein
LQGRHRSRRHRPRQSARRRGNFAGVTGRREGVRESTAVRVGEGLCCQGSPARLRMADLDGTAREAVVTVFALVGVGLFSCTMSLTTTPKPPSVTAPPQHTRMPSHNPRLAPTPAALSLCRAPPSHTPPHAELSHRHAHPSPGRTRLARTPARALPRPAAATPLPRHPRHTHLVPSSQVKMPCPCILPLNHSPS